MNTDSGEKKENRRSGLSGVERLWEELGETAVGMYKQKI